MKPEQYAKELKKSLGPEESLRVAKASLRASEPTNWNSGGVNTTKDKHGNVTLDSRTLQKTYAFWQIVTALLSKSVK